jgi:hypothetical protein
LFDENGIFCIQTGREEKWPPKFVGHGQIYINLGNVFAEYVHFLFSLGEFGKLRIPASLGASNLGLTSLQVCLL